MNGTKRLGSFTTLDSFKGLDCFEGLDGFGVLDSLQDVLLPFLAEGYRAKDTLQYCSALIEALTDSPPEGLAELALRRGRDIDQAGIEVNFK
ncbi:MAG: hypothetical protein AB1847_13965 [bacterium]